MMPPWLGRRVTRRVASWALESAARACAARCAARCCAASTIRSSWSAAPSRMSAGSTMPSASAFCTSVRDMRTWVMDGRALLSRVSILYRWPGRRAPNTRAVSSSGCTCGGPTVGGQAHALGNELAQGLAVLARHLGILAGHNLQDQCTLVAARTHACEPHLLAHMATTGHANATHDASNGCFNVHISYRTHPRAHTSDLAL